MTNEANDLFTPPPSAVHTTTPDGELFIWQPQPRIIAEIINGVFSMPMAHAVIAFNEPILKRESRLRVFMDFHRMTEYMRDARDFLTAYSMRNRDFLEGAHMLLSSKMVALGVSSYKHEIGDPLVHTYADRASFLRSYARSINDVG